MQTSHETSTPNADERGVQVAIIAERYKYIINELSRLNGNTHRNLNLFRALTPILLMPALYAGFFLPEKRLAPEYVDILMTSIFVIICLIGVFVIVSIVADIFSWMDYRKEEVELLNIARFQYRKPPNWRHFWRWHETYAIIIILAFLLVSWWLIYRVLIPILKLS